MQEKEIRPDNETGFSATKELDDKTQHRSNLHKLQLQILRHLIVLNNTENSCDYVSRGVTQIIKLLQPRTCIIKLPSKNIANHILHVQRMRLVTDLRASRKSAI